ncbi:MAG: hypothetical protein KGH88_01155 [Thaumarchaeota archaeon]|nr:hypothetical protein [Nitrososphaerota archaeon]
MFLKTKNRKAISAVLATLIILVATVVLGTGVILFGTSLFQTNAQSSGLAVQGVHVWINSNSPTTYAWGAAEIRNSGDKILSVDQISVRGTQIPFSSWYFDNNSTRVTAGNFQSQLIYSSTSGTTPGMMESYYSGKAQTSPPPTCPTTTTAFGINESTTLAPIVCFSQASGPISLKPGDMAITYFKIPNGVLSTVDSGSASSVALYAGNVGAPQSITVQSQQN